MLCFLISMLEKSRSKPSLLRSLQINYETWKCSSLPSQKISTHEHQRVRGKCYLLSWQHLPEIGVKVGRAILPQSVWPVPMVELSLLAHSSCNAALCPHSWTFGHPGGFETHKGSNPDPKIARQPQKCLRRLFGCWALFSVLGRPQTLNSVWTFPNFSKRLNNFFLWRTTSGLPKICRHKCWTPLGWLLESKTLKLFYVILKYIGRELISLFLKLSRSFGMTSVTSF